MDVRSLLSPAAGSTSIRSWADLRRPAGSVVALDIDGVLLDSSPLGRGSWQEVLEHRYAVSPHELVESFFQPHWQKIVTGQAALKPILRQVLRQLRWPIEAHELIDFWFEADYHPNHRVIRAVQQWHRSGVSVVLATNQEENRASFLRERLTRLLPIEGMVFSGALGVTKDSPRFFELAEAELGLAEEAHIVFVDDDEDNVRAASRHGWAGLVFEDCERDLARIEEMLRNVEAAPSCAVELAEVA
jgi:putative hydrolase of the HAD superfamily